MLNENIFRKRKNDLYVKYNEEDWDEFELDNNQECVVFYYDTDQIKASNAIIKIRPKFGINIDKNFIPLENDVKEKLTQRKIYINGNIDYNSEFVIISIVIKDVLMDFYRNIHESCRKFYVTKINKNVIVLNSNYKKINELDSKIIDIKKKIVSFDEFPQIEDMEIKKDEYIVIGYDLKDKKISSVDINVILATIEKNETDEGYYLINVDNGNQILFLEKGPERIKEVGYIIYLSKNRSKNKFLFVTNKLTGDGSYQDFLKSALEQLNISSNEEIEKLRSQIIKLEPKIESYKQVIEKIRKEYNEFNFSNLVKEVTE